MFIKGLSAGCFSSTFEMPSQAIDSDSGEVTNELPVREAELPLCPRLGWRTMALGRKTKRLREVCRWLLA
jgi:hypothetical protein